MAAEAFDKPKFRPMPDTNNRSINCIKRLFICSLFALTFIAKNINCVNSIGKISLAKSLKPEELLWKNGAA